MHRLAIASLALLLPSLTSLASQPVSHWDLQEVDAQGAPVHPLVGAAPQTENRIVLEGVVLNNWEDMLDPTAAWSTVVGDMGGQWQIYVAGTGDDSGGTALWMGQNYGNRPWMRDPSLNYTDTEWQAELQRLGYTSAGRPIRRGDAVRVNGYALEYGGKANINERHNTDEMMNFTVEWLGHPGVGVPQVITMTDVMNPDDGDPATAEDIFDPTRATGGERYQSRLVRIEDVRFADDSRQAVVADGRSLPIAWGRHPSLADLSALDETFDVVGIFDQEGSGPQATDGYRLWVLGYDGSADTLGTPRGDLSGNTDVYMEDVTLLQQAVLAGDEPGVTTDLTGDGLLDSADVDHLVEQIIGSRPGDANLDWSVSLADLSTLAANWGGSADWSGGDFNSDGTVSLADLSALVAHWGHHAWPPASQTPTSVPEPASLLTLTAALAALAARQKRF
ncbi:MAG: PEP-CTERM sorting domain-containing protein [Phycisphaerae bacterium]